jgi:hypothetical protein
MIKIKGANNYFLLICASVFLLAPLIISTLKINYFQINANLKAGYGLTDESFALNALRERLANGLSSYSFPFSEPLVVLFWIARENTYFYRLSGLILLTIISIFFYFRNATKLHLQNLVLIALCFYLFVAILTIPSVFRYLLVTPSYQWTVLVASVLLNVIVVGRQPTRRIIVLLSHITLAVLIFSMALSRPTSGGIAFISLILFLLITSNWKSYSVKHIIFAQASLIFFVSIFNVSKLRSRFMESVKVSQAYDPNGYSLLAEITDVISGVYIIVLISFATFFLMRYFLKITNINAQEPKLGRFIFAFTATFILLIQTNSKVPSIVTGQKYILSVFIIISILAATLIETRDYIALFVISFLPYTSQFGSNTPAIGNVQILLICQSLLLVGVIVRAFFTEPGSIDLRKKKNSLSNFSAVSLSTTAFFLSLAMYHNFAESQVGNNFEKTLYPAASSVSKVNGLYYTSEKLQSLDRFAQDSKLETNEQVIDLSSFHLGLVLYAGGIQSQRALPDKFWIYNIEEQVKFVMDLHGERMKAAGTKILVETNLKSITKACVDLSSLVALPEISNELRNLGFNPKVRVKGVYGSQPEDLTLYPNDALLVETCNSENRKL